MDPMSINSRLLTFKNKIDEAVAMVPEMSAEEKLRAVQFWNVVSEKLQDIVNNSADINALAKRMEEEKLATSSSVLGDDITETLEQLEPKNSLNETVPSLDFLESADLCQNDQALSQESSQSLQLPAAIAENFGAVLSTESLHHPADHVQHHSSSLVNHHQPTYTEPTPAALTTPQGTVIYPSDSGRTNVIQAVPKNDLQPSLDRSFMSSSENDDTNGSGSSSLNIHIFAKIDEQDQNEANNLPNLSAATVLFGDDQLTDDKDHTKIDEVIDGKFKCDQCAKSFDDQNDLMSHKWIHSKPFSCGQCDARFSTKGNLLVHQRRHTGEKPFSCDKCTASFSTKGNLKRHIKAHSGERPWACTLCDSKFTEKKSLKVHMRRHTGEKPYKCSVCRKAFSQTGVLQTHMALHLDERKHLCEMCGKAFRQRSQLRLHVLRHEGIKKWSCYNCSAKFLTKGDLERHFRVHTGERPFICDLCGKTFTRQQSLNEHSNRHFGLKPYSCSVCNKKFAEMSACYKHIKIHKQEEGVESKVINNCANYSNQVVNKPDQPVTTEVFN